MKHISLRLRLFLYIMLPLMFISIILAYWRLYEAKQTTQEIFDRSLLAAALAISRDVVISQGDALSSNTHNLISEAAGGKIFYHVMGLGGVYLSGYAYPPIVVDRNLQHTNLPQYYEGRYRSEAVRIFKMSEIASFEDLTGNTVITVWQRLDDRNDFFALQAWRSAMLVFTILFSLATIVWFGVAQGLKPLFNLQSAIQVRSPDDLRTIKRHVPKEIQGIVQTLNHLLLKVSQSIQLQQEFISNAAHQLLNPAAAVLSMAQSARHGQNIEKKNKRLDELVSASKAMVHVCQQLLSLEKIRSMPKKNDISFDLIALIKDIATESGAYILKNNINFSLNAHDKALFVKADPFHIGEAIKNLIDNCMKHAGDKLSKITIDIIEQKEHIEFKISDDGIGLDSKLSDVAFKRFSQIGVSEGSGLGLSIAKAAIELYDGKIIINPSEEGASLSFFLHKAI